MFRTTVVDVNMWQWLSDICLMQVLVGVCRSRWLPYQGRTARERAHWTATEGLLL